MDSKEVNNGTKDTILTPKQIDEVERVFSLRELATHRVVDAYLKAQDTKTAHLVAQEIFETGDLIFKLPYITIDNARSLWQAQKEKWLGKKPEDAKCPFGEAGKCLSE